MACLGLKFDTALDKWVSFFFVLFASFQEPIAMMKWLRASPKLSISSVDLLNGQPSKNQPLWALTNWNSFDLRHRSLRKLTLTTLSDLRICLKLCSQQGIRLYRQPKLKEPVFTLERILLPTEWVIVNLLCIVPRSDCYDETTYRLAKTKVVVAQRQS